MVCNYEYGSCQFPLSAGRAGSSEAVTAIKIADHHSVAKEASVVSLGLQQVADLDETRGRRDSE
ncbi:hypothetical protein ONS95_001992 [Cadophora gregata]|uniref:uncharacterized protein n=1 Tax=Cadophora gregata TaxID=51156 RepID=UPI0026DC4C3A|nr:uncharacterized protein ONS95_001992 [Cadophora gregata]KAK0111648.1 hypothetical protein ONS95_001992 [Cadophora gregata]